jgi:hypothetical protein
MIYIYIYIYIDGRNVDRETPGNRIQVSGARYLKPVSRKMSGGKHSL